MSSPSFSNEKQQTIAERPTFRPARPWQWVIWTVRNYIRLDLALHNRLHVEKQDLEMLRDLPKAVGIILAANHADETDFKVCVELSRLSGRRFLYLMNSEAFDEGYGIAGWWLQRLGAFSLERGGNTAEAKCFAIKVVERAQDVLVIFPEGEIYYLNDLVQPFKSGAVDIGMRRAGQCKTPRHNPSPDRYYLDSNGEQ